MPAFLYGLHRHIAPWKAECSERVPCSRPQAFDRKKVSSFVIELRGAFLLVNSRNSAIFPKTPVKKRQRLARFLTSLASATFLFERERGGAGIWRCSGVPRWIPFKSPSCRGLRRKIIQGIPLHPYRKCDTL